MKTTRRCVECGKFTTTCGKCHHRAYCYHCNSCVLHGQEEPSAELVAAGEALAARRRGGRWLVQVAFLTKRGWSETFEVRVRAKGLAGAVWHGTREARTQHLPKRTVVRQARVTAVRA